MLLTVFAQVALAACPTSLDRSELASRTADADQAFARIEWPALQEQTAALLERLPCAHVPLRSVELAPVYRLHGWALFSNQDDTASAWLAAAHNLAPAHQYDPPLAGPMAAAWNGATTATDAGPQRTLPQPQSGALLVDGVAVQTLSVARPHVVQLVGSDGGVTSTWLLPPGADAPSYPTGTAPAAPAEESKRSPALWIAAGGAAALGVGGLVGAAATKTAYARDPTEGLYTANVALAGAGWGLLGVGGVLGGVATVRGVF